RLFSRLVRARTAMDVDLALETGAKDILSQESVGVRLLDRALEHVLDVQKLAPDIDVGNPGPDGVAGNGAPFDQQMRVALHEQVILEGSWFALVGVAGDVLRVRRFLVDELPLHSSGKPGAAPASQARCLDDVDDLVGFARKRFSQAIVALVFPVEVERKGIRLPGGVGG